MCYNVIGNDKRECGTYLKGRQLKDRNHKKHKARGNRVCKSLRRSEISLTGYADGERSETIIE